MIIQVVQDEYFFLTTKYILNELNDDNDLYYYLFFNKNILIMNFKQFTIKNLNKIEK